MNANPALVKALTELLAKARVGKITDAVIIGVGYSGADPDEWYHFYTVEKVEDMPTIIGEMELLKDALKANVHQSRAKAQVLKNTTHFSGLAG